MIDLGKKEHSIYLEQALNRIGKSPEDVTLILATHGHKDHVQEATIFKNASFEEQDVYLSVPSKR
uniref:MBL fold metallo-hydrolase n=1 Tax=Paenisporosarcina sp. FSL H8-0542 TaxID=2921401 RepID=UPI00406CBCCA